MFKTLAREIQETEFDATFTITEDGHVRRSDEYAPGVYHDEINDIVIDSDEWSGAIPGCTGQHMYNGHVMHSSELINDVIARILYDDNDAGTVFAIVAVHVLSEDDDDVAGWMIVRKTT